MEVRTEVRSDAEIKKLVLSNLIKAGAHILLSNLFQKSVRGKTDYAVCAISDYCYPEEVLLGEFYNQYEIQKVPVTSQEEAERWIKRYNTELELAAIAFASMLPDSVLSGNPSTQRKMIVQQGQAMMGNYKWQSYNSTIGGSSRKIYNFQQHVLKDAYNNWLCWQIMSMDIKQPKLIAPKFRYNYNSEKEEFGQDIGHLAAEFQQVPVDTVSWFLKQVVTGASTYSWTSIGIRMNTTASTAVLQDAGVRLARKLRDHADRSGPYMYKYLVLDFDAAMEEAMASEPTVFPEVNMDRILVESDYHVKSNYITASNLRDLGSSLANDSEGNPLGFTPNSLELAVGHLQSKLQDLAAVKEKFEAQRARLAAQDLLLVNEVIKFNGGMMLMPVLVREVLMNEDKRCQLMCLSNLGSGEDPVTYYQTSVASLGQIAHEFNRYCGEDKFLRAFNSEVKNLIRAYQNRK